MIKSRICHELDSRWLIAELTYGLVTDDDAVIIVISKLTPTRLRTCVGNTEKHKLFRSDEDISKQA